MMASIILSDRFKTVCSGCFIQANWRKYGMQGFVFLDSAKLKSGSPISGGSTKWFNVHATDLSKIALLRRTCMISL